MSRVEAGGETIPYRTTSNAACSGGGGQRDEPGRQRDLCVAAEGHFQHAARQLGQPPLRDTSRMNREVQVRIR
jgi:hypothetical protein